MECILKQIFLTDGHIFTTSDGPSVISHQSLNTLKHKEESKEPLAGVAASYTADERISQQRIWPG